MRLKKSLKVWGQKKWGPGTERETRSSSSERSWTSLLNYYKYSKLLNGLSSCPLQKAGGLKIVPNPTPINYQTFLILFKIFIKPFKTFLICFGIFSYIFIWFYRGFFGYEGLTNHGFESIMHAPLWRFERFGRFGIWGLARQRITTPLIKALHPPLYSTFLHSNQI